MKGLLLYTEEDSRRNQRAVRLFQEAGQMLDMQVELVTDAERLMDGRIQQKPDFVINRTRDWKLGRFYEKRHIPVFNSSEVSRICNDKAATLETAEEQDIPVLPWVRGMNEAECSAFYREIPGPKVAKTCEGHGGTEVLWVDSEETLGQVRKRFADRNWILQQAAAVPGKDLRIYMLGNRVVKAMLRTAENGFKSNYCLGGRAEIYTCKGAEIKAAKRLAEHLKTDYVGVDFLFHENGQPVLNEVEDAVGARMLYEHTNVDIIREYMEYIREKL